jgi:riboflavin biosynthesis pyrimidine reductase
MPNDIGLMQDTSTRRIVVQAVDKPRPKDVEVITLPRTQDWIAPEDILTALRQRGLHRILIEGGSVTIAQFLEARLLTRLHVAVAPLLIGAGPQGLTTSPVATLGEALRPRTHTYALGADVLFDCLLDDARTGATAYPLPCRTQEHLRPLKATAPSCC